MELAGYAPSGNFSGRGSAGAVSLSSFEPVNGVLTGKAPPNAFVVVAVQNGLAQVVVSDARGNWTATIGGSLALRRIRLSAITEFPTVLPLGVPSKADTTFVYVSGSAVLSGSYGISASASGQIATRGTNSRPSGKFYFEAMVSANIVAVAGLMSANETTAQLNAGTSTLDIGYDGSGGAVIGVAADLNARTVALYLGNVLKSTVAIPFNGDAYPFIALRGSSASARSMAFQFGNPGSPLTYSPPAGFTPWL